MKLTLKVLIFLLVQFLVAGLSGHANAELKEFAFYGTLSTVSDASGLLSGTTISEGATFKGRFSYDTASPPVYTGANHADYPAGQMTVIVDGTYTFTSPSTVRVLNDSPATGYTYDGFAVNGNNPYSFHFPGNSSQFFQFLFTDSTASAYSNTALPSSLSLNSFNIRRQIFIQANNTDGTGYTLLGEITELFEAKPITVYITATVAEVYDFDNMLGGSVAPGDVITGSYTYNPGTLNSPPYRGIFYHHSPPYGIKVNAGGLVFQSDPNNVNFVMRIFDGGPWAMGGDGDGYGVQSYNNISSVPNLDYLMISWSLWDHIGTALSSYSLPLTPPELSNWLASHNNLTISWGFYSNIYAQVTSATLNTAPALSPIGGKSLLEGKTLSIAVSGTDADGDPLTYSASNIPAGSQFNAATRVFSWTPNFLQAGVYPGITFTVSDGVHNVSETITITVINVDTTYTPQGTGVSVTPQDALGATPVALTFTQITTAGSTTLTTSQQGPPPPSGFKIGDPPNYFEIATTAQFTGQIDVCVYYGNYFSGTDESMLKLLHRDDSSGWQDVTTSIDTTNKKICGKVDSLSPFVVAQPHPTADAGPNLVLSSENQDNTVVQGTAAHFDGVPLYYRWLEGLNELSPCQGVPCLQVGTNGEAHLDLASIPNLSIGQHTLTLEVSDGSQSDTDTVNVTVDNSVPHAAPTGGGVYQLEEQVVLGGEVSDFDGDSLTFEWLEGGNQLFTGQVSAVAEGIPVSLPQYARSGLSLGQHFFTLRVSDGINEPVSSTVAVSIQDSVAPTLAPSPNKSILWPPTHSMLDITIAANATDNSGEPLTLTAAVKSNEAQEGLGDGDLTPDWSEPTIDEATGEITLKLRAERSGSGNGRVYTVTVTATDQSGNSNSADVNILVPHDQKKK